MRDGCGICTGDVKVFEGALSFRQDTTSPAYMKAPVILDYECIGYVVGLAEGVEGFKIGDCVISEQIVLWDFSKMEKPEPCTTHASGL